MGEITIYPFLPRYQQEAKELILAGLTEHWGFLDAGKNLDLEDIAASYAQGLFLVAKLEHQVVGTGALLPLTNDTAQIVRMSVKVDLRRNGIGRKILDRLIEYACKHSYKQVVLETTETWQEAVKFYLQYGFSITHHKDGDVYFNLDLHALEKFSCNKV